MTSLPLSTLYGTEMWCDRTIRSLGLESTIRPHGRPKKQNTDACYLLLSFSAAHGQIHHGGQVHVHGSRDAHSEANASFRNAVRYAA